MRMYMNQAFLSSSILSSVFLSATALVDVSHRVLSFNPCFTPFSRGSRRWCLCFLKRCKGVFSNHRCFPPINNFPSMSFPDLLRLSIAIHYRIIKYHAAVISFWRLFVRFDVRIYGTSAQLW